MSSLRARLNAISPASPGPARPNRGGLVRRVYRFDADPGLQNLSPTGLRRVGWQGGAISPERILFLDTETTGLSGGAGTLAFMVGVGYLSEGALTVEQLILRDYSDEPQMLMTLCEIMRDKACVVTFNGKTFDLPLLSTRYTMCRMGELWRDPPQIDLLHAARRVWKLRLGHCRLTDLEERILGQTRGHDLPGSEAPQRFFSYLRTGDFTLIDEVADHNRQDVASLMTLLVRLCGVFERPREQTERQDLFSLGRALERQGELHEARELYRLTAIPRAAGSISALSGERLAGLANWRQYLLLRRCRDEAAMREILLVMVRRRQMGAKPMIELAKLSEHRDRDPAAALLWTRRALENGECDPEAVADALRRTERLKQKLQNRQGGC